MGKITISADDYNAEKEGIIVFSEWGMEDDDKDKPEKEYKSNIPVWDFLTSKQVYFLLVLSEFLEIEEELIKSNCKEISVSEFWD